MKIFLVYNQPELGASWKKYFFNLPDVDILQGDITKINCDAVVSPANSFGFMDGGLDLALIEKFGASLETKLQNLIKELPEKELLIGKALVLETGDKSQPYLISAPTMRVPMSFNIHSSINAYLAMKAILLVAINNQNIKSIAIPGLCTGVGKMPFEISAFQMYSAYKEIILNKPPNITDFDEAQKHQLSLNPNSFIWSN